MMLLYYIMEPTVDRYEQTTLTRQHADKNSTMRKEGDGMN